MPRAHPKAYPLVPRYEDRGVRRRVYGNDLIFYRIGIDTVDVLHVLHGAMDHEPLLFPEGWSVMTSLRVVIALQLLVGA